MWDMGNVMHNIWDMGYWRENNVGTIYICEPIISFGG